MNAITTMKGARSAPTAANIQLMQPTTACWTSRCLHVIAEMGVADAIDDLAQTTEALAKATGAQPQELYRVLRLLASMGVFEWHNGKWQHTEASRLLRSDHPGSLRDYVRMLGMPVIWNAFTDLHHSLRTGESAFTKSHPEGIFAFMAEYQEESQLFDSSMTAKSHRDIAAILPAYEFAQLSSIADIAGGRGHLLRAILKGAPNTQGILFDQPHVVAQVTPEKGEKLSVLGGNLFTDHLPRADAYLLMKVIHDWPDAESIRILSAIRRDMPSHARVLVIEAVVPPTPGPHLSKELDIVMMAIPGGMERTREEYASLGSKGGLRLQRVVETMSPYSILEFT